MTKATLKRSAIAPAEASPPFVARVLAASETSCTIETGDIRSEARSAASCLLVPEIGDEVLVVCAAERCWILAVLERDLAEPAVLRSSAGLTLDGGVGPLRLRAAEEVEISSARRLGLQAPELSVVSRGASLVTGSLSWIGEQFDGRFESVRLIGRFFDSLVERFSRKAQRSYRETTDIDQVRSGEIDYQADANVGLQGRNILARASELAKIDADQIHLG